jgi:hypothetical protein
MFTVFCQYLLTLLAPLVIRDFCSVHMAVMDSLENCQP